MYQLTFYFLRLSSCLLAYYFSLLTTYSPAKALFLLRCFGILGGSFDPLLPLALGAWLGLG